jgi:hypothetical protein
MGLPGEGGGSLPSIRIRPGGGDGGERGVVLNEPNPQKILTLLKKMGHFPVLENDPDKWN